MNTTAANSPFPIADSKARWSRGNDRVRSWRNFQKSAALGQAAQADKTAFCRLPVQIHALSRHVET